MNDTSRCLSDSALGAIADNRLSDTEREELELHLDTCRSCRDRLETASADGHVWESARALLHDDEFDQERFGGGGPERQSPAYDELLKFLAPTDDPHMLGRLGGYEIAGIVGSGGMAIVLKALEPALGRFVALKVLAPKFWQDPRARERFAREARAAASIVHENVIEIYGVAESGGIPFFTMPYLSGDTLQRRIDRQGPLRIEETLRVAMQVASGLAAAHAQGLVHRDIKPANILLGPGAERVRITDFGIAHLGTDPRMTQSGMIAGTPQYMSPEQVRGEAVDGRSDLFSLGSMIYAMCTGRPPFEAGSSYEQLHKVVTGDAPCMEHVNPAVPTWLAAIVARLHAPAPADRYQSARELAVQLEQCLASLQQPDAVSRPRSLRRLEARYRRQRWLARRRLFLGGMIMSALAIVLVALVSLLWTPSASVAADAISVHGRVVDAQGQPVSGTTVLAVQKTWPDNRFRQRMLKTTTDERGQFVFEDFAQPGKQYAFLLTVVSDKWLMTSEYRVVEDGSRQDPVTLTTQKSQPVTLRFVDAGGQPLSKVEALPTRRFTSDGKEHLSYTHQVRDHGVAADDRGEVRFASWKAGEKGAIVYGVGDNVESGGLETAEFTVPESRSVTITVPARATQPPAPPVHVAGQVVDAAGKPLADVKVLAIQKTWPNNRYRQDALSTTTDAEGKFRFDKFARGGRQYAFLLTVVTDGYAMTSDYQLVRDGSQKGPVALKLEPAQPVTLVLKDSAGKPLEGIEVSPNERTVDAETSFLSYFMHFKEASQRSDRQGQVSFTAWKPGESGTVFYRHGEQTGELKFTVPEDRKVELSLP